MGYRSSIHFGKHDWARNCLSVERIKNLIDLRQVDVRSEFEAGGALMFTDRQSGGESFILFNLVADIVDLMKHDKTLTASCHVCIEEAAEIITVAQDDGVFFASSMRGGSVKTFTDYDEAIEYFGYYWSSLID